MSEDDSKTITSDDQPKEKTAPLIEEAAAHYSDISPHLNLVTPSDISETLGFVRKVGEGQARQKQARKRSLRVVNEHSEPVFNAASPMRSHFSYRA